MKTVIILFIIQATLIASKTINYPRICKTTKRTQPREKRSEYAGFITEPNIFDNLNTENNQDFLFDAYNRAMDVSLQTDTTDIENINKLVLQNGQDKNKEVNNDENAMVTSEIADDESDNNDCIDIEDLKENVANFNNGLRTIVFIPSSTKPADINYEKEDFKHTTYTSNYYKPGTSVNRNGNNEKTEETTEKTDITNMREVREHLLDHLLEYFINIIKEEQRYTLTRKNFNKDKMKLEDKLRNYYSPEHVDQFIYENSLDTNDTYDYNDNNNTVNDLINKLNVKDLIDNVKPMISGQNKTKIDEESQNNANETSDSIQNAVKDKPDTENNTNKISRNINHSNEHKSSTEEIELPINTNDIRKNADLEVNTQNCSTTVTEEITPETPNNETATEKTNENEREGNKPAENVNNQSNNDTSNFTNDTKPDDIITSIMKENTNNTANIKSISEDLTKILDDKRKNKQNNEQRSIDINNRTIRIKKTISGPAKSKLDEILSSNHDLSTGICKKNIILQFNINI